MGVSNGRYLLFIYLPHDGQPHDTNILVLRCALNLIKRDRHSQVGQGSEQGF